MFLALQICESTLNIFTYQGSIGMYYNYVLAAEAFLTMCKIEKELPKLNALITKSCIFVYNFSMSCQFFLPDKVLE